MTRINILVVEDDPSFSLELELLIKEADFNVAGIATNIDEALRILSQESVDLALIDIFLSEQESGIELAHKIKNQRIPIIFMTAHKDRTYYEDAKDLNPFAYLVKPFDRLTLVSAIHSLLHLKSSEQTQLLNCPVIYIRHNREIIKVQTNEILWVQSDGNYAFIHTETKKFAIKKSMVKILKELPENLFLRIHRGFSVRLGAIERIDLKKNVVHIKDEELPIGRSYRGPIIKYHRVFEIIVLHKLL